MTRPAIIIGLGGTGQWVLTYLKKDLLELNDGKMPDNVRLLAFDTVSQAEAKKTVVGGDSGQAAYEQAAKKIGTIELEPDYELVHIGGDCKPLADEIEAGKWPHLNWFDVDYWKNKAGLGRDNWILDRGAGRFRQFGLLAVYKDLLGGPVRSEILKRMNAAINEVMGNVEGDSSFEIIFVGSVAGGTGSSMLVPFGVLARKMCEGRPVRSRAIIVLPSAFSPGSTSDELYLRGGAALRELARAMMPPEGYQSSMTLVPNHPDYGRVTYSRPFDGIYFIDGSRGDKPINKDPKYGVFPAIAAWARQILDDQSGEKFTNFVSTNASGSMAYDPKRLAEGVFGVFGAYSFYTPERTLRRTYQLKLANRILRELADPVKDGAGGKLVSNRNPKGAMTPTSLALEFLSQPAKYRDEESQVTTLMTEVARIVTGGGKANGAEVKKKAEAGWLARQRNERLKDSWIHAMTDLPKSGFDDAIQTVNRERTFDFYNFFRPSDSYSPPRDPGSQPVQDELTKKVDDWIFEHHAGMGAAGKDDYGKFGDMAAACSSVHLIVFRNLLRIRLLSLLGDNSSKGRLGYAINVLGALENQLFDFEQFMDEVEKERESRGATAQIGKTVTGNKANWLKVKGEQPTLPEKLQGKKSSKALKAEKAYIDALGLQVDLGREKTLHNHVSALVKAMKEFCLKTRQDLERWEVTLLEGDKTRDINGMLEVSDSQLQIITTNIREDQRSDEVEKLVQVSSKESEISDEDVTWAMNGIKWQAQDDKTGLKFGLDLAPVGIAKAGLRVSVQADSEPERRLIENENMSALTRVLNQRFGEIQIVKPVLEWIQTQYPDPKVLTNMVYTATEPMTSLASGAQPAMEAVFVSVNKEKDPANYTGRLGDELRKKILGGKTAQDNSPIDVVSCVDKYRLTAIRTQIGITLDEFGTWQKCNEIYEKKVGKVQEGFAGLDSVSGDAGARQVMERLISSLQSQFTQAEEKAAVSLEVEWRAAGQSHRTLHPRVVSLLGRERQLNLALQAWALGWIVEVEDTKAAGRIHWEIQIPDQKDWEFWLTPNTEKTKRKGALEAIESFVLVGKNFARGREGSALNWIVLSEALNAQRKPAEPDQISLLKQKVTEALAEGGLIAQWLQQAGEYHDPQQDKIRYNNPSYKDLADVALRYYRSIQ